MLMVPVHLNSKKIDVGIIYKYFDPDIPYIMGIPLIMINLQKSSQIITK